MFQFQNETFQFDFVKCQLQILKQSVATATDLSFHFICKLLHILEKFILSKSILIICSHEAWGGVWVVIAISSILMLMSRVTA